MGESNNIPPQAYTKDILAQAFVWVKSQPPAVRARANSADALVSLYLHHKRYGDKGLGKNSGSSDGTWENDAPVSVQNFKSDLKNLAKGLEEFDQGKKHGAGGARDKVQDESSTAASEKAPTSAQASTSSPQSEPPPSANTSQGATGPTPQVPPSAPPQSGPQPSSYTQPQNPNPPQYGPQAYQQPPAPAPPYGPSQSHYRAPQHQHPPHPQTNAYQRPNTFTLDERSLDMIRDVQYRLNLSSEEEAIRALLVFGYERLRDVRPPQY